ncbi:TetR/AcrR family transcriptional regulator [Streptomyces sp. TP-A0874]|uniref:TetR/AcrR family transcriptional regulator n=1 Tax=Streptomyces sp. TP-A0874 TaxID=549819 RepID=UPI001FCCDB7A|nr:TetR/AcrR family transcriptional regulator [Streptomyces sp. TP-A0874]
MPEADTTGIAHRRPRWVTHRLRDIETNGGKRPPAGWQPSSGRGRKQKGKIVDAALQAFTEAGYANVSMASIAEGAGVSTGSLYRYFPSKELLFISVLDHVLYDMYNAARTRPSDGSVRESITMSTAQYLRAFQRNRKVIGSAIELMASSETVRNTWWAMREQLHQGMLTRLCQHQQMSRISALEPELLITTLTSMVDGFGQRAFVEGEFGPLDEAAVDAAAAVLAGVWYRSIFGSDDVSPSG